MNLKILSFIISVFSFYNLNAQMDYIPPSPILDKKEKRSAKQAQIKQSKKHQKMKSLLNVPDDAIIHISKDSDLSRGSLDLEITIEILPGECSIVCNPIT